MQDYEAAEWAPTIAHMEKLVTDLIPRLHSAITAHERAGEPAVSLPTGLEEQRDYLVSRLEAFENRYASIFAEFDAWSTAAKELAFYEYRSLAAPFPGLGVDSARMAMLRALPTIPDTPASQMTLVALRDAAALVMRWTEILASVNACVETAILALAGLRSRCQNVVEHINRNTIARSLTMWALSVPVSSLDNGYVPVRPMVRTVDFD
jgi:hypothetical protein